MEFCCDLYNLFHKKQLLGQKSRQLLLVFFAPLYASTKTRTGASVVRYPNGSCDPNLPLARAHFHHISRVFLCNVTEFVNKY